EVGDVGDAHAVPGGGGEVHRVQADPGADETDHAGRPCEQRLGDLGVRHDQRIGVPGGGDALRLVPAGHPPDHPSGLGDPLLVQWKPGPRFAFGPHHDAGGLHHRLLSDRLQRAPPRRAAGPRPWSPLPRRSRAAVDSGAGDGPVPAATSPDGLASAAGTSRAPDRPAPEAPDRRSARRRYCPVYEAGLRPTSSGVPSATISPPSSPPSGPRSTIQSAVLMTSRLCSMTITVLPTSTSRWSTSRSRSTSAKCSPTVG